MLRLGVHRKQAADHAAFPGTRQIEMPFLRAHQKVPAAFPVLGELLSRVIVAIEDRDHGVVLHCAYLASNLRQVGWWSEPIPVKRRTA